MRFWSLDILFSTRSLRSEVLARIEARTKGQVSVAVWRGREAADPDTAGKHMCHDLDAVRDVQKVGGDPQELVCAKGGRTCPFYDVCGYQRQRRC